MLKDVCLKNITYISKPTVSRQAPLPHTALSRSSQQQSRASPAAVAQLSIHRPLTHMLSTGVRQNNLSGAVKAESLGQSQSCTKNKALCAIRQSGGSSHQSHQHLPSGSTPQDQGKGGGQLRSHQLLPPQPFKALSLTHKYLHSS